ncbi:hypothetical protein [Phytohabitans suffuscus]|uniref:Peptidase inhibitor family I36 n=1 Tax=Phytohabitans suffuscus TaxID=624315 RepID=A0A6F8YQC7_9ACTN|nr:hypothetical protein [Phytohabitans suffuscus]BCB88121.1 hypothetical protein Psuf_054340 [Phytohabitans suffuscus]
MMGSHVKSPNDKRQSATIKQLRRRALVVSVVMAGSFTAAVPAQAASPLNGCPVGYFCIYPQDAGYNNNQPSHMFYYYGWYNLSNMYGNHAVVNNQFGEQGAEALVDLCDRYNGRWQSFREIIPQGQGWYSVNFTPINSIKLYLWGGSAGYGNGCVQI